MEIGREPGDRVEGRGERVKERIINNVKAAKGIQYDED